MEECLKLKAEVCNFTKSVTPSCLFSRFLNFPNGTKSRKAAHLIFAILVKTPRKLLHRCLPYNTWYPKNGQTNVEKFAANAATF